MDISGLCLSFLGMFDKFFEVSGWVFLILGGLYGFFTRCFRAFIECLGYAWALYGMFLGFEAVFVLFCCGCFRIFQRSMVLLEDVCARLLKSFCINLA